MTSLFTEADYTTYKAVRALADLVFAEFYKAGGSSDPASRAEAWLEDRRNESVNPFYDQTENGLVLELYYGLPSKIHTPWGGWSFTGSGSSPRDWFEDLVQTITEQTQATVHCPSMGRHGPWFALGKIGDYQCGPAVPREIAAYLPYESARDIWAAMTARYKQEKTLRLCQKALTFRSHP